MPRPRWRLSSLWRRALPDGTRRMIHARLADGLAAGFDPPEQIVEGIMGSLNDESPERVRSEIARTLPLLLGARERERTTWPAATDCDRLDAAFEELNSLGIMARHHWHCCQNCGHAIMPYEFERLGGSWNGVPIRGYVFYHIQDTERAVADGGVHLAFGGIGSDDGSGDAALQIARAARDIIEQFGLSVEWSGDITKRPLLRMTWQRRNPPPRFTEAWSNAD